MASTEDVSVFQENIYNFSRITKVSVLSNTWTRQLAFKENMRILEIERKVPSSRVLLWTQYESENLNKFSHNYLHYHIEHKMSDSNVNEPEIMQLIIHNSLTLDCMNMFEK